MAKRYGGKFSPDPAANDVEAPAAMPLEASFRGRSPARFGARINILFLLPLLVFLTAFFQPVTEMVTGLDLVREQIQMAAGIPLSIKEPRKPRGHSIELRINAEDSETFAPSPGRITGLNMPGGLGVRVDTHIYEGYTVPPHYDSLIAKLIVTDDSREAAIRRAQRCLGEFVVEGIRTNIDFHKRLLAHPDFRSGEVDTGFVERWRAPVSK